MTIAPEQEQGRGRKRQGEEGRSKSGRRRPLARLRTTACWPLLIAAIPLISQSFDHPAVAAEPLVLSEAQEVELGKKMDQELEKQPGFCGSPELVAYINQVGQRVAAQAEPRSFRYTFRILDDDSINALALPGGYIYVTRGLLAVLNDEAELAAVIGHEVGHACSRHAAKQLTKARLFQLLTLGALGAAAASPAAREHMDAWLIFSNEFFTQILLGYGRENELEADEKGIRFAFRAGYDPRRMSQFLRYLRTKEQLTGLNFQGFRVTHPETAERIIKADTLAFVLASGGEERLEVGSNRFRQHLQGLPYGPRADRRYLRIYESKPGDTLFSIASDLLNDSTRAHEIAFLNRIKEDTPLEPGTLLKIP